MNTLTSKKGQAENYFAVITYLFAFGFLSILGLVIYDALIGVFSGISYWDADMINATNSFTFTLHMFDYIMVLVLIVLIIGVGITSYKIAAPPVFFVITFIMAGFYGLVSYFFNYVFQEIVSQSVFESALAYFPRTILICTNLHWVMLAAIIIGSITLYAKKDQGQYT